MTLITTPCIELVGHGFTATETYVQWATTTIQDDDLARRIAERMLAGESPYRWNPDEPEFYVTFTVTARDALTAQLADEDAARVAAAEATPVILAMSIFPRFADGKTGDEIEEATADGPRDLLAPLARAADRLRAGIFAAADTEYRSRAVSLELTLEHRAR